MKLPNTPCMFDALDNTFTVFCPLTGAEFQISPEEITSKWSKVAEVLEKSIQLCKDQNRNPLDRNCFYGYIALSKESWEWILTFSMQQKAR